jgi:hypothetical protein
MKHKGKVLIVTTIIAVGVGLMFISNTSYTRGSHLDIEYRGVNMSKTPEAKTVTQDQDGHLNLQ